jgi:hypothetical protein
VREPPIAGASPQQRELLREILAGLGATLITGIVVREYDPGFEGDELPPPGPYGDEIAVTVEPGDGRGDWEAGLLARAFARRSQAAGGRSSSVRSRPDLQAVRPHTFSGASTAVSLAATGTRTEPQEADA